MNLAEINIDCLRAAESLLRDHDARIAAAAEELKSLRRERVTLAERVQACIDVLCGRATPDLFTPAATPPPADDVPVAVPVVVVQTPATAAVPTSKVNEVPADTPPAPPASGLLRDIPGITADDADDLDAAGLRTLADLEEKLTADLSDYFRATRSVSSQVYKVLVVPKGVFLGPDADRVANAMEKYLTVAEADEPTPANEPAEVPAVKAKGEKKAKAASEPKPKSKKGKVKA